MRGQPDLGESLSVLCSIRSTELGRNTAPADIKQWTFIDLVILILLTRQHTAAGAFSRAGNSPADLFALFITIADLGRVASVFTELARVLVWPYIFNPTGELRPRAEAYIFWFKPDFRAAFKDTDRFALGKLLAKVYSAAAAHFERTVNGSNRYDDLIKSLREIAHGLKIGDLGEGEGWGGAARAARAAARLQQPAHSPPPLSPLTDPRKVWHAYVGAREGIGAVGEGVPWLVSGV